MKPLLMLIPGVLCDARAWQPVAQQLGAQCEVRIADVRGQSSIAEMAADCWAALADVAAPTPLVLAGFSMGGYVAAQMLARPARSISALVLVATSVAPEPAEKRAFRERTMAGLAQQMALTLDAFVPFNLCPESLRQPALVARVRQMMSEVGAEVAVRQIRAVMARADHRAQLAELRVPTLVLCGDQDQVVPLALAQENAALISGAQLEVISPAGHMLPMEQPQAVAESLRRWLAGLPAPLA